MKFEHIYNTFKARLPATLTLKPCLFKPLRAAIQTMNTTFRFRAVRPAPPTYSHLKMICSVPGYEFKPVINRGEGCRSCALMRIWHDFRHVDKCIFCNKYADRHGEQLKGKCKVRGHCLFDRCRSWSCPQTCDIHYHFRYEDSSSFCHNMKGFDSRCIVKHAYEFLKRKQIKLIAKNSEK